MKKITDGWCPMAVGGALILLAFSPLVNVTAQNGPPCFFSETFDGTSVPGTWLNTSVEQLDNTGTPLGTYVDAWTVNGSDSANVNGNFPVPYRTGRGNFAMANDDASACDCDMLDVKLTSPVIDLSGRLNCALECDVFLDQNFLGGEAKVQASSDGAAWTDLRTITSTGHVWQPVFIDLSAYDGIATFQLRFTWTDNGQWAAGVAIDEVCVYERLTNDLALVDAQMADITVDAFDGTQRGEVYRLIPVQQCGASNAIVSAVVLNRGTVALTDVSVTADAEVAGSQVAINTSSAIAMLGPGERATLTIDLGWSPDVPGEVTFHWNAQSIGSEDEPGNQAWIDSLLVTDQGFDNGNHQMAIDRSDDDGSIGLPGDKFSLGNRYELEGSGQMISGILVRYDDVTAEGSQVRARLMDGLFNELATGDVVEVSSSDLLTSSWTTDMVYLPFTAPYGPITGDVFAMIESTPDSGTVRIACSGASPYGASALLKGLGESIQWTSRTPLVRLAFSAYELGLEEQRPVADQLLVFPSPACDHIRLDLPWTIPSGGTITIFSASGSMLVAAPVEVTTEGTWIDVRGLSPGIYAITLVSGRDHWQGRFAVAR